MSDAVWPEGVGPHEEIEYRLMVERRKYVALFIEKIIPKEFIENPNRLNYKVLEDEGQNCLIYFMPGYGEEAKKLLLLLKRGSNLGFQEETEREIGHILGYEDWEIDAFLKHIQRLKK